MMKIVHLSILSQELNCLQELLILKIRMENLQKLRFSLEADLPILF
jgi:hypothetical protein